MDVSFYAVEMRMHCSIPSAQNSSSLGGRLRSAPVSSLLPLLLTSTGSLLTHLPPPLSYSLLVIHRLFISVTEDLKWWYPLSFTIWRFSKALMEISCLVIFQLLPSCYIFPLLSGYQYSVFMTLISILIMPAYFLTPG